jgi:acyl-CoA synthetase (AMP-forming)/AMP-acid ligase II
VTLSREEIPVDICDHIRERASEQGDRPAVICDGETLTYAELHERSCRLANALAGLGVQPGERVATLGDNCPQTLEQMSGIALGAYVRSSLYTHNSADTNLYLLDLIEAAALLVQRKHYDALAPRLAEVASLRHVLVFDGDVPDQDSDYERALEQAPATLPQLALEPEDPYIIRFSAGTTGKPKGILHTLAGWVAISAETALEMPPLHESDRYLAAGPLAHAAALPVAPTLAAGGTVVVMRAFDPQRFLALVEQERCTTTMLVPTMIQMVVGHSDADRTDLSSLRWMLYGAAPISEQTLERALALWGPIMQQMYGQSEGVPLTVLPAEDHVLDGSEEARRRLRSAGRPTRNCTLQILDPNGNELPVGEVGEIAALTPTAMAGIWRDEQTTSERILPDGALLTRDMGYLDEDGYLFLADRKEDMIISGGFNIWPAELENALASHPAVAEVAVVGVPHEKWGETPKAVVVLREGHHASEQELIDWTREKLGAIKRVTSVDFAEELPKTPLGKVLRRVVRDRYLESEDRLGRV